MLVREAMLMCARHWAMVPRAIQVRVWSAYRRDFLGTEYLQAVKAAVEAVAQRQHGA